MRVLVAAAIVAATAGVAHAYPQFQLSRDQSCTDCHLSPAGGGLLSENGLDTAESSSALGTDPGPLYGKVTPPGWLAFGGDLRWATGYYGGPNSGGVAFPMQAELEAAATVGHVSLHVTGGARDPEYDETYSTLWWSREHWLQWQEHPGEPDGLFVRAGRFMPVFGLRFVEHPDWTRRYGGAPLYGEAYGVAVEEIQPAWEVHATGFVHDPWQATTELGDGAAVYAEARVTPATSVGIEGKLDVTPDDKKEYGGLTAKHYAANILVQAEAEAIHQTIDLGGHDDQLVAYVMGTYFLPAGIMIDLGLEAYEPDVRVRYLDQEGADLNVHWFSTSHLELVLTNHFQMQELGEGGLSSGYSLLQIHYRI